MLRRVVLLLVLLLIASACCIAQSGASASKRPMTFEDMMALRRIGDPQVSPDGKWVLFNAVDVSLEENTRKPHLWLVPLAGGGAKQLTSGAAGEDRGRFSPDGRQIAFVSARDGGSQIWLQDFDTANGALSGEPKRLTNISTEADGLLWSPDGKNIVFTSDVYPECNDDACNKSRDEALGKSKVKAKIFQQLYYRHWVAYTRFKRSHLFVVSTDTTVASVPRDITPGNHDVPPFNLGGQDYYAISPDGQEVAYTSNLELVEALSTNKDIFIVPITGGTPKKISTSPGSDSNPTYSPDGKYIAFRSQLRPGFESDRFRLVIYDRGGQTLKDLTPNFDRWVESFAWAPDSQRIYFPSEDKGEEPIYTVKTSGGDIREVIRGSNDDLHFSPDGKTLVFSRMSVQRPNEIYRVSLQADGQAVGQPAAVTQVNDAVFAQLELPPLERFSFAAADKTKIEGFLLRPPGFDANKKYPVKFLIHGGPQGAWGEYWSYRWNAELFAANGYVVVLINPRGSTGYGQKFIDQIRGDWGGRPYTDLLRGLDYVEATFPFVEKGSVCALGASYGGYMVNWIIGHTTRFKCAVSHDGMFNSESAWGTTEELYFNEWEFEGTPWSNRAVYRKWSPHLAAPNFKTPTLVVHGQLDYRLEISEGFQLFTTLQRLKVPSKMLYFPDEGHWVLKPQNSQLWYKTVNDWVDAYLKKTPANQ
jgi:dipeptidyl aminopeptidase/acylaminoacyl peptidase